MATEQFQIPLENRDVLRLRWRIDYTDGRQRFGVWDLASDNIADMHYAQPKEGQANVFIEAQSVNGGPIIQALRCAGHECKMVQGEKIARFNLGLRGSAKIPGQLFGVSIVTETEKVTVNKKGIITRVDLEALQASYQSSQHSV